MIHCVLSIQENVKHILIVYDQTIREFSKDNKIWGGKKYFTASEHPPLRNVLHYRLQGKKFSQTKEIICFSSN